MDKERVVKVLHLVNPFDIQYSEQELPVIKEREVLIKVMYVAICGSDKKLYCGQYGGKVKYPIILGHEWVGVVSTAGENAKKYYKEGDVVTGDCSLYCDDCPNCQMDKNQCLHIQKKGITVDGALCEYLKCDYKYLYNITNIIGINSQDALDVYALTEPLAVALHGINKSLKGDAQNALVIGSGGIGSLAALALSSKKVKRIVITDVFEEKLEVIKECNILNVEAVPDFADIDERFDFIIEASGSDSILNQSIQMLNSNGTLLCVGHHGNVEIDWKYIVQKSLSIIGTIGGTGDFEEAITLISKNKEIVRKLFTRRLPFSSYEAIFETSNADIKTVIAIGAVCD